MLKGLGLNPFITNNSPLAEIEAELTFLIARAEELDWDITQKEEQAMIALTRLAKAKGSTKKW